jgi:hypothetical protein
LAILSLSVSAPIISSKAFATNMDGRGTCSDSSCSGYRYREAMKAKAAPKGKN